MGQNGRYRGKWAQPVPGGRALRACTCANVGPGVVQRTIMAQNISQRPKVPKWAKVCHNGVVWTKMSHALDPGGWGRRRPAGVRRRSSKWPHIRNIMNSVPNIHQKGRKRDATFRRLAGGAPEVFVGNHITNHATHPTPPPPHPPGGAVGRGGAGRGGRGGAAGGVARGDQARRRPSQAELFLDGAPPPRRGFNA